MELLGALIIIAGFCLAIRIESWILSMDVVSWKRNRQHGKIILWVIGASVAPIVPMALTFLLALQLK